MINNLISFIETLKVEQILFAFAIYLIFLWLLVPIWVYLDSKKKFKNEMLSALLFMLVLPLNIPGLLFYIIIRPEDDIYEDVDDDHVVNIPIVNFVSGKNDLVLGFEIKLNGNIIKEDMARDINLKVDLDHGGNVEFKEAVKAIKEEVEEDSREIKSAISTFIKVVKTKFKSAEKKEKDVAKVEEKSEVVAKDVKSDVSDKSSEVKIKDEESDEQENSKKKGKETGKEVKNVNSTDSSKGETSSGKDSKKQS